MHRNDIEIGLWPLRFCIYGLFWYAKCGFKWCKFVLNILLFVLLGAYGVVLRCRHKVTEIFSYIKLNSLHLTKKIKHVDHGARLISGLMIILLCIISATKYARS